MVLLLLAQRSFSLLHVLLVSSLFSGPHHLTAVLVVDFQGLWLFGFSHKNEKKKRSMNSLIVLSLAFNTTHWTSDSLASTTSTIMRSIRPLLFLLSLLLTTVSHAKQYPQTALKCHATAAARGETICPEDRNNYCIKAESTIPRGKCGTVGDYRFDEWDRKLGRCVYRTCAASCLNGTTKFGDSAETEYERMTYCCSSNKCNAAIKQGSGIYALLSVAAVAYLVGTM